VPGVYGNAPPTLEWASSDPALCPLSAVVPGACTEIGRVGRATVTARVRGPGGVVVAEGHAAVLSELGRMLVTDGPVTALTRTAPAGRVLAGGRGPSSLLVSDDGGESWAAAPGVPDRLFVSGLTASPVDLGLVAAAAADHDHSIFAFGNTLFLSEDGGRAWREIGNPDGAGPGELYGANPEEFPSRIERVVFHPTRRQTLFLVTVVSIGEGEWRIYRTDDLGTSWERVAALAMRILPPTLFIDPTDPLRLYVGSGAPPPHESGYVSADGGATWSAWPPGAPQRLFSVDASGRLYGRRFVGGSTLTLQQLVRSSDHGRTWEVLLEETGRDIGLFSMLGHDVMAVGLIRDTNAGHVVRISVDGGATWATIPLTPADYTTFARPNVLKLVGYDGSVVEAVLSFSDPTARTSPGELWKVLWHRMER
jgi:hypothetical protein